MVFRPSASDSPPIQFVDRSDALRSEQAGESYRNNELTGSTISQLSQGEQIQMIVVIVGEKH